MSFLLEDVCVCVGNWPVDSAFNPESRFYYLWKAERKEIQYNGLKKKDRVALI